MNLQCWTQMFLLTHVCSINSTLLWLPRKLQLASLEWTFIDPENFDEGFKELLPKLKAELEDQEKEGRTWKFHLSKIQSTVNFIIIRWFLRHKFADSSCIVIQAIFFLLVVFFRTFYLKNSWKVLKNQICLGSNWYGRR